MEIRKVGVLGCGLMGSGIAQTCATAGMEVVVREVSDELCARGLRRDREVPAKFAEKGTITPSSREKPGAGGARPNSETCRTATYREAIIGSSTSSARPTSVWTSVQPKRSSIEHLSL